MAAKRDEDNAGGAVAHGTQPGQVIGGRYRLGKPLGAGGFGQVWQAHDETLDTDVAIKEIWLPPATSVREHDERLRRAHREARNAAKLRHHPNIVTVHEFLIDNDRPWIVLQFVAGRSLQQVLDTDGRLPVARAVEVARAMLSALGAAHAAGIVHRDVKPGNVMLADNGAVLLTDFGIALHHADPSLTATGMLIGSAEYMAPERLNGVDGRPASDLFSLGVTLYQAVENVSPFRRDSPASTLAAVAYDQAPPPPHAGRLAPLIMRLLVKNPAQRAGMAEALALVDKPPTRPYPAPPSCYPPGRYPIPKRAPGLSTSRLRNWVLAYLVVVMSLLAAGLTIKMWSEVSADVADVAATSAGDGLCGDVGTADLCNPSLPVPLIIEFVLLVVGALAPVVGVVVLFVTKSVGQWVIIGGGAMLLVVSIIIIEQDGPTGEIMYDLIAGIVVSVAGVLAFLAAGRADRNSLASVRPHYW